jgi:hypothetical protein
MPHVTKLWWAAALLVGCTGTSIASVGPDAGVADSFVPVDGPAGTTDGSAIGPDLAESPLTPPSCSGLSTADVPSVDGTVVVGSPPVPTGGAIADGRYILTTYTLYAPASEPAAVMVYGLLEVTQAGRVARSWDPYTGVRGSLLTAQGTTLTFAESCPGSGTSYASDYSASGSTLRLYLTISPGRVAESTYSSK